MQLHFYRELQMCFEHCQKQLANKLDKITLEEASSVAFIKTLTNSNRSCPICAYELPPEKIKSGIVSHIRTCHIEPHYDSEGDSCSMCKNTTETFGSFIRHYQEVHGLSREEINDKGLVKTSASNIAKRTESMLSKGSNERRKETHRKMNAGSSQKYSAEECMKYINGTQCNCCGWKLPEGKAYKLMYKHVRDQHLSPKDNTEGDICPLCNNPEERHDAFKTHFKQVHGMTSEDLKAWKGKLDSKATKAKKLAGANTPEAIQKKNEAHLKRRTKGSEYYQHQEDLKSMSVEKKKALSVEGIKKYHADPLKRKEFSTMRKKVWENEDYRCKVVEGAKEYWNSEEGKDNRSELNKKQWAEGARTSEGMKKFWNSQEGIDIARERMIKTGNLTNNGTGRTSYTGKYRGMFFESILELKFIKDHEEDKIIKEPFAIPYTKKGRTHKYYPDFLIGDTLYEIKREKALKHETTQLKIEAAKEYCFKEEITFEILTEKNLFLNREECKEFISWAFDSESVEINDIAKRPDNLRTF